MTLVKKSAITVIKTAIISTNTPINNKKTSVNLSNFYIDDQA